MKTCVLTIDASSSDIVQISVRTNSGVFHSGIPIHKHSSRMIVSGIEKQLLAHSVALSDLTGVEVHKGPGSFTGLRVGAVIGQMLGLLLEIPVNKKDPKKTVVLTYDKSAFDKK